jgi:hypothetical protein
VNELLHCLRMNLLTNYVNFFADHCHKKDGASSSGAEASHSAKGL